MDLAYLKAQFARNRSKTAVLVVLVAVMVVLVVRLMVSSSPRSASATLQPGPAAMPMAVEPAPSSAEQADMEERVRQSQALWRILRESRGLTPAQTFTFDPSYFTLDPARHSTAVEAPPRPEYAGAERISPKVADAAVGPPRPTSSEPVSVHLQLQSTVLGMNPIALINAKIMHVGDRIEGFRIVAIQARQVTLEKDGRKVVLEMLRPDPDKSSSGRTY